MDLQTKKINDVKVKLFKMEEDTRPVMGSEYFDKHNCSIYISAKKRSGKSTLVSNIVLSAFDENTIVFILSSTCDIDPCYIKLCEVLEKKKVHVEKFHTIHEGKKNNIKDILDIMEVIKKQDDQDDRDNKEQKGKGKNFDIIEHLTVGAGNNTQQKKRKSKYLIPKFIVILDDISNELVEDKLGMVGKLFKEHRHYNCRLICSSQSIFDLTTACRNQLDFVLLLGGFKKASLSAIYENSRLHIEKEEFIELYNDSVKEQYSFLYMDVRASVFRKRFDQLYKI